MVDVVHLYANGQDPATFLVGETLVFFHFGARPGQDSRAPVPASPPEPLGGQAVPKTKASVWTVIGSPRYAVLNREFESLGDDIFDLQGAPDEPLVIVPPHGPQRLDEMLTRASDATGVSEVHIDLIHPSDE